MQNEIQVGRYNRILGKLFDMKDGAPAPVVATEIFPTVVLENNPIELAWLGGTKECAGYVATSSGAAAYSAGALVNPTGSNCLAVVTSFNGRLAAASTYGLINWERADAIIGWAGVAGQVSAQRDIRAQDEKTSCKLYRGLPGLISARYLGRLIGPSFTNETYFESHAEYVIKPGWGLVLQDAVVNRVLMFTMNWRERTIEPGEIR